GMDRQEHAQLARRVGGQIGGHLAQVAHGFIHRPREALLFGLDVFVGDAIVGDLERSRAHDHGPPDGIAAHHALAIQAQGGRNRGCSGFRRIHAGVGGYSASPKRLSNRARISASAWASSSPWASTRTVTPRPAASIITPMMLLALTRCAP